MNEFLWAVGQCLLAMGGLILGLAMLVTILFVIRVLIDLIKYRREQK